MRSALAAISLIALASVPARADEALRPDQIPERARQLADRGRAYHDAGDYANAIVAFKEAYVLAPSPGLLFNLAQAYRLAGDCDDAAWMYRRYLDTNPLPERRALAEGHLATVDKCRKGKLQVAIAPAGSLKLELPEPKPEASVSAKLDDHTDHRKEYGVWTAIGGGALLAGAAYFALDAHDASNTVEELYAKGGKWQDIRDTDARGHRSATIAEVLGIGGVAAAATGGVLYMLGARAETAQHVAVAPTAHGAEVSCAWRF